MDLKMTVDETQDAPPKTGYDAFKPMVLVNSFGPPETKDASSSLTTEKLTAERGSVYGHPLDDFGRAAKLKAVVADIKDPELRHAAEMICAKLARLCHTPGHLDSWDDIAGYGRTARMVIEERERRRWA